MLEGNLSAGVLLRPFVVEFIDHEDAHLVAQSDEVAAVGIVRGADVVHAKLLQQSDALLDGLGVGGGAECAEGMVVGAALEDHLPAIEAEAEVGAELDGAESEVVGGHVGYGAVAAEQFRPYIIQIRCIDVPQAGLLDVDVGDQAGLLMAGRGEAPHVDGVAIYAAPLVIIDGENHTRREAPHEVRKLCRDAHVAVVAGGDTEGMAVEEEFLGRGDETDVAVQSCAGVPAGVLGLAGVGDDLNQVVLAVAECTADVDLKAHVAVVGASDALTVQIDVGGVEHTLEVEQHTTVAHIVRGSEVSAVVAFAHRLEASARQGIGGGIGIGGDSPRHFYLEVMGHIDAPPVSLVVETELPAEVETFARPLGVRSCRSEEQHYQ